MPKRKTGAEHLDATKLLAAQKSAEVRAEKAAARKAARKPTHKETAAAYGITGKQLYGMGGRDAVNAMPFTGREILLNMARRTLILPAVDVPLELAMSDDLEVAR